MKIGIVLAGGMNNGIYEIGCLKAISEKFPSEDIVCISSSSIGALAAYSFATNQLDLTEQMLKEIDVSSTGRFFPSFSRNKDLFKKITDIVKEGVNPICPTYTTAWNYTRHKLEYVPFHKLSAEMARNYLCASVAIPIFNKGVKINNNTYFDGAFIDNIPVFPLLEQDLDAVFCIYFENKNYFFENPEFDKKVIKLWKFPRKKRSDAFVFDPNRIDEMIEFGYQYTSNVIQEITSCETLEEFYENISRANADNEADIQYRITAETILSKVNKVAKKIFKRKIL